MDKKELDEYMENLWYLLEKGSPCISSLRHALEEPYSPEIVEELQRKGYINVADNERITVTPAGYEKAKQIVRCHRLAERLLCDVLGMQPRETERGACDFEHVIVPEIADSICTLLGHPRECPHGMKIPEGKCCREAQQTLSSAIVPLNRVRIGDLVKVAYVKTTANSRMHKLSHFGIIPGATLRLHQKKPSFVIQCDNTQVAMEEDVVKDIFVLYPEEAAQPSRPSRKQWRFMGRGRIRRNR